MRVIYPRLSREELLAEPRRQLPALADEVFVTRVALFGSWANGRATAYRDIDLLVIYQDPPRNDAFRTVRQSISSRGLEPRVYTCDEAERPRKTLERMTHGVELL